MASLRASGDVGAREIAAGLAAFAVTVALAVAQRWSPIDLVWSLWIASAVVGTSLLVTSLLGTLVRGDAPAVLGIGRQPPAGESGAAAAGDGPAPTAPAPAAAIAALDAFLLAACIGLLGWRRTPIPLAALLLASAALVLGGRLRQRRGWRFLPDPDRGAARILAQAPVALFLLAFFAAHFLGFHLLHALFLNGLLPLSDGAGADGGAGGVALAAALARTALRRYWPFVATSALSQLPSYARAFATADASMLVRPYVNVIRMHVAILVLGAMTLAGLGSAVLYPLLAVYFLPVDCLARTLARRSRAGGPAG